MHVGESMHAYVYVYAMDAYMLCIAMHATYISYMKAVCMLYVCMHASVCMYVYMLDIYAIHAMFLQMFVDNL